jgi:predicted transcriptional regulator
MLGPSLYKKAIKTLLRELLKLCSSLASIYFDLLKLEEKEEKEELKKEIKEIKNSTIQILIKLNNLVQSTSDEIFKNGG